MPLKIAHISDTHLGYKSFGATEAGVNQREVDVLRTFKQALDQMLLRDPDIVIHSGDMFDVVRPSNYTLVHTFRMLTDFQRKRNGKPFVIVAGNHETPRNAESGNILQLFEAIEGIFVEAKMGKTVFFENLDLEVLCIPNASLVSRENVAMVPTGNSKYSILAVHGVETKIQTELKKADATDFDLTERDAEQWTYVALGDYHVHKLYGPNACYAGSTDYTSTNFWDELKKPKGWVWFDTSVGMLEFINVKPRTVIDLPFIDASKHLATDLEEVLSSAAVWETADLPIVRQLVKNVRPEVWAQIGFGWKRDVASRCVNYQLELKTLREAAVLAQQSDQPVPVQTLETEWKAFMSTAEITLGVDRERAIQIGIDLLGEVAELENTAITA